MAKEVWGEGLAETRPWGGCCREQGRRTPSLPHHYILSVSTGHGRLANTRPTTLSFAFLSKPSQGS